jgi:lambda repressor-like predicted transcriptional regulator
MNAQERAQRDDQIRVLRAEGLTIAQIEEQTGFSHGVVQRAVEAATVAAIDELEAEPAERPQSSFVMPDGFAGLPRTPATLRPADPTAPAPGRINLDVTGSPKNLDKRLRTQARAFDHRWQRLEPLIAEAKTRQIHKDLGFKSWPDYIADVTRTEMPNVSRHVDDRRQVVALLAGEGMSQRAIADAVDVSQSTIRDDLAQVSRNHSPEPETIDAEVVDEDAAIVESHNSEPTPITGRDGKTYPRKPKPEPKPKPNPWARHGPRAGFSESKNRSRDAVYFVNQLHTLGIDTKSLKSSVKKDITPDKARQLADAIFPGLLAIDELHAWLRWVADGRQTTSQPQTIQDRRRGDA